jgi:hypothetical protein
MSFNDLMPMLQGAIGPVILISGVGLLLLSMTNRFSRVLDISRQLAAILRRAPESERQRLRSELEILYGRARLLRTAIALAILSVLTAALLVISLFLAASLHWQWGGMGALLFIVCLLALIASLCCFLLDFNRSLKALKLELHSAREETK